MFILVHLVINFFFKGTVVVVSAGNYGLMDDFKDACHNSPASATKASVQLQ